MARNISQSPPTKLHLLRSGARFEEAGDIASAEEHLEQAYSIDNKDKDVVIKLFRVLVSAKKLRRAEEIAEQHFQGVDPDVRVVQMYIMMDLNSYTVDRSLDAVRAKLSQHPHASPILARAALTLLWHGDIEEAKICTEAAIRHAPNARWGDAIRLLLARRAYNYGQHELSDWICQIDGVDPVNDEGISYSRLQVRTGNAANNPATYRLFAQLLERKDFHKRRELCALHADFVWRFEGPSQQLLDLLTAYIVESGGVYDSALLMMQISLAMQLGQDNFALTVLRAHPELVKKYASCLSIAKLAHQHDLLDGQVAHPHLPSYASLYDALADSEAVLRRRFGADSLSIAVIGNSACEKGLGKGNLIDRYDEVVRFNRFQTSPPFDKDYGNKLTTHVRLGQDSEDFNIELSKDALVVISSASTLYRGRAWRAAKRLFDKGQVIAVIPQQIHTELSQLTGGSPSSGLSFVYLLKAIRGSLKREDFMGFSFVDQVGAQAASAHYFEAAKPSSNHQWQNERRVFDSLFEERP